MHDAYIISSIFKRNLIESIEGYGDKLIIGTKTGQIVLYCIPSADSILRTSLYTYLQTPDKKTIRQLKLVPEENLLFVLTNGVINVYSIRGIHFILVHSCVETKGCNIFAADVKITRSQSDETATTISLCVNIKSILKFFVWKSESLVPLAKQIQLKDEPKALSLMDNIICIGFNDEYVAYNISSEIPEKHDLVVPSPSKTKSPSICLIKNSIFGITEEDFLVLVDPNTFKKDKEVIDTNIMEPIKWGSRVLGLVWDEPYIIGRTANSVEIHALEDFGFTNYSLIQTLPDLNNVRFLVRSGNGVIFAASETEVWYLRMVDVSLQRETLLTQKKFKLSIELTNLSSEPESSKKETIREMRISYANYLLANKKFAFAFTELLKAEVSPKDVIHLFPASIQGELETFESSSLANIPVLEGKDLEDATLALIDYLIVARKKDTNLKSELISIMDTALLKCYLQTNDSLLGPLLRRKQCNFLESEKALRKYGKLNELILLYEVFEEHKRALTLLKDQASIPGSSLFGHERTVKYLQNLDSDHKALIFEYSQWVLEKHPEDGLTIFTNNYCESENNCIPKKEVLDFLAKTNEILVLPYLEHVVYALKDPTPIIHEELIRTYVEEIKKLSEKRNLSEVELKQLESNRCKLFEILEKFDKYCPERVLQFFPPEDFFEERVLVLQRMNDHEKILVIYIQILGNLEKALEYCEKVHDGKNDKMEILLRVLLNPLKTSPYKGVKLHSEFLEPSPEIVIQLLNKYPTKMNPAIVFPLLPGDIPVHRLKNYIEMVTRMHMKQKWHYAIVKETLNAEIIRLNEQILLHRKKNYVGLTESSICKECQKHFNNKQVLVRNTNSDVVHLACFKK